MKKILGFAGIMFDYWNICGIMIENERRVDVSVYFFCRRVKDIVFLLFGGEYG